MHHLYILHYSFWIIYIMQIWDILCAPIWTTSISIRLISSAVHLIIWNWCVPGRNRKAQVQQVSRLAFNGKILVHNLLSWSNFLPFPARIIDVYGSINYREFHYYLRQSLWGCRKPLNWPFHTELSVDLGYFIPEFQL